MAGGGWRAVGRWVGGGLGLGLAPNFTQVNLNQRGESKVRTPMPRGVGVRSSHDQAFRRHNPLSDNHTFVIRLPTTRDLECCPVKISKTVDIAQIRPLSDPLPHWALTTDDHDLWWPQSDDVSYVKRWMLDRKDEVCTLLDVEPLLSLSKIVESNPEITCGEVADLVLTALHFASR